MKLASIVVVALIILAIVLVPLSWYNRVYNLRRAIGDLNRASSAGNVELLIRYYKTAYSRLTRYSGNPVWLFGTSRTNIDNIKDDIAGVITRAEQGNITQQELDEMKDTAWRISEQLELVEMWVWITPINLILIIFWCIALFIAIIFTGWIK